MALFFQVLYHQIAWTYDLVAAFVSFGKWKSWVLSIIDLLDETPTLELGFGPGHLQKHLAAVGFPIFGLDFSPQMCQIARRRLRGADLTTNLTQASSTAIPFPSSTFNQVIATFPSEYIFLPETLLEVRRVIIPGGYLVILVMARITGNAIPHRIMDWVFRIAGQTEVLEKGSQARMLRPFVDLGLKAEIKVHNVKNAELTYLTATLPN